jgi:2-polyprenyl-3-methyl-5-hydroxy-6-metoxy-1,4-benzoquinol methylase
MISPSLGIFLERLIFFGKLFKKYVPFQVKNILEPACGTGRFLISLAKYGYRVTGYDINPKMIAYAKKTNS